jgi:hypothetical protein
MPQNRRALPYKEEIMKDLKMQEYVIEKIKEAMAGEHCYPDLITAGQAWLDSLGTDGEAKAAAELIAELEEDVLPIDYVIEWFGSGDMDDVVGKEEVARVLEHANAVKEAGGEWCDCPSCTAGKAILDVREFVLAQ